MKPYKCESCEKCYFHKNELEKHIKTVHENIKSHKCVSCGKYFGHKQNLQKHIQIIHEKI